jgi:hypothetical protein
MSHEIHEKDDVMLERTAWHRLGRVVGRAFSWLDAVSDELPITLPVKKVAVSDLLIGYECQADEYAAVRSDGFVIATGLGEQWTPFHASEGYELGQAIFDQEDSINANLLSLGTLYNGRVWFMTFDLGDFNVVGYEGKDYLTVSGSYDSSRKLKCIDSPTLVVCGNTLAAHDFGQKLYTFKHTSGIKDRVEEAKRAMQAHRENQGKLIAVCEQLASVPLSASSYSNLLAELTAVKDDASTKSKNVADNAREQITQLYKGAPVNNVASVTNGDRDGFTFVQAVNTYEQWLAPIRKAKGADEATTRALRQFDSAEAGAQPLTDKAIGLVLASV